MDTFIKHFIRGQADWWECVSAAEFDGPQGLIQVRPGARFFPDTLFMGVDIAKVLDAQYLRGRSSCGAQQNDAQKSSPEPYSAS